MKLGGITDYQQKIINADRIIIVACGTSWHAGLIGEYLFEDLARIPVEVEYASEFRYRNHNYEKDASGPSLNQGRRYFSCHEAS